MYHPHFVPVGEDQKQHVELIRDIAGAVNRKFDKEIFILPEAMIKAENARIKSLRDGTKKMSKSDPSDQSRINLGDDRDTIYQKFKRAKTDSIAEITYDAENRPEIANLINIYSELSGLLNDKIVAQYEGAGFSKFKEDLAELACEVIGPITSHYNALVKDPLELLRVLRKGADRAGEIAEKTVKMVKKEFGFFG